MLACKRDTIMSVQLVQSLQDMMLLVHSKTPADALIGDRLNTKRTYADWIATAEKAVQLAEKSVPELNHLVLALKYRTQLLKEEAPAEFDPLIALFKNLSARLFPSGIPDDFADKQIRHLCSNYPSFAKELLEPANEKLAADFFRFALLAPSQSSHRSKNTSHWVDIFVQYPEIAERLMKSSLYEKLGHYPENIYIIPGKGVCLKMEFSKEIGWFPIHLDTSLPVFRNKALGGNTPGITLTLEELFKQFESPLPPDLDVSSTGIVNINSQLLISKDSNEKIHLIDPMKWPEYMPSVELELPELMKLFPEATNESPYAFILRVNVLASKDGQAFFDFIMRLDNGKYRVISLQGHQKPGDALHRQKRVFYPLTAEQGTVVINMVAEEITRCRNAYAEGKPIPSINIQSYLDAILGHDFYALLEKLVNDLFPFHTHQTKEELKAELSQVRKNLDTAAFQTFLRLVVDRIMVKQDMGLIWQFINTSLTTIHSVLQKDGLTLPTVAEVTEASKNNLDKMGPSLVALASLCFEVLHPYRISVAAAEKDTPVIGFIFRTIDSIPWEWLKNLLYDFFLTILGPFRGYHYKSFANPHPISLAGLLQSVRSLVPERYINRPSQLFDSLRDAQKQSIDSLMKKHLEVLTVPVDNKIVI
jgi:hypothetical protein